MDENPIYATADLSVGDCRGLRDMFEIESPVSGDLTHWILHTWPEKLTSVAIGRIL